MRLIDLRAVVVAFLTVWLGVAASAAAGIVVTVNSSGDASDATPGNGVCATSGGVCTLRAAIQETNARTGLDTINFSIGSGVQHIAVSSALPTVTSPAVIDGWTQPGFSGAPLIEIRGGSGDGLKITAGGSTVRGLVINGFDGRGLVLATGGSNVVEGNYIGLDANGADAVPNDGSGLMIDNSPNNRIGGLTLQQRNVISGNTPKGNGGGIEIDRAGGNVIQGNYIGTDVTGMQDRGNDGRGIALSRTLNNIIGGPQPGAGNLIAGNWASGVRVLGGSNGTLVQANIIGMDSALTGYIANDRGVQIRASHDNQVIGNVIGGQVYDGVIIWSGSNNNRIYSNSILHNGYGDRDPTEAAFNGVYVMDGIGNYVIGNIIRDNFDLGIRLDPAAAENAPQPPTITSATVSGSGTLIVGYVTGPVGIEYVVDLFANTVCDYNGAGEGEFSLGQIRTTVGVSGEAPINALVGYAFQPGRLITTTATRAGWNTSTFSACTTVQ